jgi:hypothetical protein
MGKDLSTLARIHSVTAAGGTSEMGTGGRGSGLSRVWRVWHLCRGAKDGLGLQASHGPRDAAHDQAAVDALPCSGVRGGSG